MRKKFKISTVIALTLVFVLTAAQLPAFAGNISDTKFDFYMRSNTYWTHTEGRAKQDSTSGYINVTSLTAPYLFGIAASDSTGTILKNYTGNGGQYVYRATTTGSAYIYNGVYEDHYFYACLIGKPANNSVETSHGWWSPDSI